MTDEEYEKQKILAQSKNKGLDLWKKVLANYGIPLEKALKGVFVPNIGYIVLYFDEKQDKWMYRYTNNSEN